MTADPASSGRFGEDGRVRAAGEGLEVAPRHRASAVAWGAPSPVALGRPFMVKVGVACGEACSLGGLLVEVRDPDGRPLGRATLGAEPWPGTQALYWAEVALTAPLATGLSVWTVELADEVGDGAHRAVSAPFSVRIDPPPEHRVSLTILKPADRTPLRDVDVWLGAYRGVTDERGVVALHLPPGTYDVRVCADGFEAPPTALEVHGDLAMAVVAVATLTAAEREARYEAYEASQWG